MNKTFLSMIVSLLALHCSAQRVMTLGECVAVAVERNLDIRMIDNGIKKSDVGISQARAQLLPTVYTALGINDNLINPVTVTGGTLVGNDFPDEITWQKVHSTQYQGVLMVNAEMPLLDLTRYEAVRIAREMKTLANLQRDKAIEMLTMQVARTYYLAQTTQEQARLMEENVSRMDSLIAIVEALRDEGVVLEIDVSRVSINRQNLQVMMNQYSTVYEQQLNLLRYLMNLDASESIAVTPLESGIRNHAETTISNNLPEMRINEQQHTIVQRQISQVKKGYLPKVSLTGSGGYTAFAQKLNDSHWYGNLVVGLKLTVPIFDANAKRHKLQQLRLDGDRLQMERESLQSQLKRDYDNNILNLNQNRDAFYAQRDNYRLAQEVYEVALEKYKAGIAPMSELLQDEINLRNASSQCAIAIYQYNCARLNLLRLTGNLNELIKY